MSNKRINKAYVRYDGSGRVIPGSLILNRFKPKVGNWSETPAYECCNFVPTSEYTIGQSALGGKIAYIFQPGDPGYVEGEQHGLVATVADNADSIWGCVGTNLGTGNPADKLLGAGNQNTIDIMAGCATAGIAARVCGDLTEGGYSDWYLPSLDELGKLYINRVAIGGFVSDIYICSNESEYFPTGFVWCQIFSSGTLDNVPKDFATASRAIRTF